MWFGLSQQQRIMRLLSHSSSPPPPPQWDGEENQNEKAKLVGCGKNSLAEEQREKKVTTIILTK